MLTAISTSPTPTPVMAGALGEAMTATEAPPAGTPDPTRLTEAELAVAVAEASDEWARAVPGTDLSSVVVRIADLPDLMLGRQSGGAIEIDPTAAGFGWGTMDLLTVVRHELGHVGGAAPHGCEGYLLLAVGEVEEDEDGDGQEHAQCAGQQLHADGRASQPRGESPTRAGRHRRGYPGSSGRSPSIVITFTLASAAAASMKPTAPGCRATSCFTASTVPTSTGGRAESPEKTSPIQ